MQSLINSGHVQALLGVYLLGVMAAADAAAVRAHLDVCQGCRDEHDYLAVVPRWLDLVKGSAADWPQARLTPEDHRVSPQ